MTPQYWLTQAQSATTDTWVSLAREGVVDYEIDSLLVALRGGDDSALAGYDLAVSNRGRHVGDMLWAQGNMFTAVSQRVVDTLNEIGASGWRAVPIPVRYGNGEVLAGYHVLVVVGECGNFPAHMKPSATKKGWGPHGTPYEWDGTDVFWVRDRPPQFTFCVTDRVRKAFEAAGLTRIQFEAPEEF
jgi:hypothetical protein